MSRTFGGLKAVDVDHLEIPRGAITALIGPNGAGKTTLFNLLTGFDKPDTGTWTFDGTVLSGIPAFKVARLGQVRTFQLTKALGLLTVLDNMKLGAKGQGGERFWTGIFPFPFWRAPGGGDRGARDQAAHASSSSTRRWRTTPRRSPAGSASCSRWRAPS